MSFRKPQYCMAYMVLAISLVGGIYIICRDYLAFVFLWERITVLPFRYLFMMIFLFLCAFICMGVDFFSNISPHNKISRYVLWCCVVVSVVLQCAGMLLVQAWKWPLPALAGALFVIQYLSCYLAGLIGVSLDIENYCTLRLLFNQSLVLDKVPEYGKPAKCCSP